MVKKILITGASSGVGLSICELLKDDYEIISISRRKPEIQAVVHHHYAIDLSNKEETEKSINQIVLMHGFIPYLINNAGILIPGSTIELNTEDLNKALQINALSPYCIMKALLPAMIENNFGRIINLTSGAPLNCFPNYGAYSASKAILNALTVTAAKEHTSNNIKINLMSPGPVRSEMSPQAKLEPEICHPTVNYLLNMNESDPTGKFFWLGYEVPLFPDLEGVNWLEGIGNEKLRKVL